MGFNHKISDTSFFAELIKDKHQRHKVLQEILDKKEDNSAAVNSSGENNLNSVISGADNNTATTIVADTETILSSNNTTVVNISVQLTVPPSNIDNTTQPTVGVQEKTNLVKQIETIEQSANSKQTTNGIKDGVCLVDIPMPNAVDGVLITTTTAAIHLATSTIQTGKIATIPESLDSTDSATSNVDLVVNKMNAASLLPPPPPPPPPPPQQPNIADEAPLPSLPISYNNNNNNSNKNTNNINNNLPVITNFVDPSANSNLIPVIKATYTITKPKNLTKLPMPPGVNIGELEDITTPSPPRNDSPIEKRPASPPPLPPQQQKHQYTAYNTASSSSSSSSISINRAQQHHHYHHHNQPPPPPPSTVVPTNTKKGLLNLPMPPMVPGSEDLSGDDDISSPRPSSRNSSKYNSKRETNLVKRKRPTILNRRNSRSHMIKDWGERCVDVFEVIAQIGEGTYGQVRSILH